MNRNMFFWVMSIVMLTMFLVFIGDAFLGIYITKYVSLWQGICQPVFGFYRFYWCVGLLGLFVAVACLWISVWSYKKIEIRNKYTLPIIVLISLILWILLYVILSPYLYI